MNCHLCDKPLLSTDYKLIGIWKQNSRWNEIYKDPNGTTIHMDCYSTWLREKKESEV